MSEQREVLATVRCLVQLFNENGKWKYEFEVDLDAGPAVPHPDLILQIDERQKEIIKGAIPRGDYFVVIDDAPQQALTPVACFFMKRLYTPSQIRSMHLTRS